MPFDLHSEYAKRHPQSCQLFERAKKVLAGGVGHDLRYFQPSPLYIARAKGGRKWDVDGNEYVDFLLGNGALLLGHADQEVCQAVACAMANGSHFGNDHPLHIEWAELVQRLVPGAERVRFVNSGTEATLLAIRLARAFTGKQKILRFAGHFHGWHDDVVHGFTPPFDADGSLGVSAGAKTGMVCLPDNNLDAVQATFERDSSIAGVILEASGASWGRVPLAEGFLAGLRDLTRRFGIVLIFDEVVSGFRFAPGGMQERANVTADLACFAKVIAGGLPGGAVTGNRQIMSLFDYTGDAAHDRHGRVVHFGTYNASPPSAAAGITVLSRIASGEPIAAADQIAATFRGYLEEILERHEIAGYVYGTSSTFHVYFETDPRRAASASSRRDLHTQDANRLKGMPGKLVDQYQRLLRFHGADNMSSTGGVLSSAHTSKDLGDAAAAFEETVKELLEQGLVQKIAAGHATPTTRG